MTKLDILLLGTNSITCKNNRTFVEIIIVTHAITSMNVNLLVYLDVDIILFVRVSEPGFADDFLFLVIIIFLPNKSHKKRCEKITPITVIWDIISGHFINPSKLDVMACTL